MATLATAYTNSRNYVPGANTTNLPDSTLLAPANAIYRVLALLDTPRSINYAGGTFGASSLSVAGVRIVTTVATNLARLTAVRYEGTDATTTDGRPLERFASKGEYENERQTYPSTNGVPRAVFWERISGGYWRLYLHPATSAVDIYLSVEGEIEPQDLTSGSSTVLLTPGNFSRFEKMLAAFNANMLNKPQSFIDNLLADMETRKLMSDWLKSEEAKGMLVNRAA